VTYHFFAQEVLLERTITDGIILEGNITVGAESAWKDGDVAKDLKRVR
jgi:hypothetical protein